MAYLEDKQFNPGVVEVAPDPFSLDALIVWLRTKPANEVYCWLVGGGCLFGQYGKHLRLGRSGTSPYMAVIEGFGARSAISNELLEPFDGLAITHPHTFGAALTRALEIRGAV